GIVLALEQAIDQRMLIDRLRESRPAAVLQQFADAALEVRGARLLPCLHAFADRRADQAEEQVQQYETDCDLEDLGAEHSGLLVSVKRRGPLYRGGPRILQGHPWVVNGEWMASTARGGRSVRVLLSTSALPLRNAPSAAEATGLGRYPAPPARESRR